MTEGVQTGIQPAGLAAREGFSAWWWLVLPTLVAVVLAATALALPGFYATWIEGERGPLELSHVIIPLAGLVVALRILFMAQLRGRIHLRAWVGLAAAACLYIAGEEASWGQHFLDWSTPESWQEINDQQETNLHNVSSWLDQKPRALLEIGVVVGGILIPLLALWRPSLRRNALGVILPPLLCLPVALLAEITRATERLGEALGGTSIVFPRASEVQELYFYLFMLFYLIVLRQRLGAEKRRSP